MSQQRPQPDPAALSDDAPSMTSQPHPTAAPGSPVSPAAPATPTPPRKRRTLRRLGWSLLTVVLLAVVLTAALPTLLSSGPGRQAVLSIVNGSIPGTVQVGDWSFGWFSGSQVQHLLLLDEHGEHVLAADSIDLPQTTMLGLVRGQWMNMTANVVRPQLYLTQETDGTLNVQRALGIEPQPRDPNKPLTLDLPAGLSMVVEMTDAQLSYRYAQQDPAALTVSRGMLNARDPAHIELTIDAQTPQHGQSARQGQPAANADAQPDRSGTISARIKLDNLFNRQGKMQIEQADVNATVSIKHLPMHPIAQLTGDKGLATELIGPLLDVDLDVKGRLENLTGTIDARGEYASVKGQIERRAEQWTIVDQPRMQMHVRPEAALAWGRLAGHEETWQLEDPVDLVVVLERFDIPVRQTRPQFADATFALTMSMTDLHAQVPELGKVSITGTKGDIVTERLADALAIHFESAASLNDQPGRIDIDGAITHPVTAEGELNRNGFAATFTAITESAPVFAILDELTAQRGFLTELFGHTLDANLQVTLQPGEAEQPASGPFALNMSSETLKLETAGTLSTEQLTINPGSTLQFDPRVEMFVDVTDDQPLPTSRLLVTVDRFDFPLAEFDPAKAVAALTVTLDQLQLPADEPGKPRMGVRELVVTLPETTLDQMMTFEATGEVTYGDAASPMTGQYILTGLTKDRMLPELTTTRTMLTHVPTTLAEQITRLEQHLTAAVGQSIDQLELRTTHVTSSTRTQQVAASAQADAPSVFSPIDLEARVRDERFEADLRGTLVMNESQRRLTLSETATGTLTLTQALFDHYLGDQAFEIEQAPYGEAVRTTLQLVEPAPLHIRLDKLDVIIPLVTATASVNGHEARDGIQLVNLEAVEANASARPLMTIAIDTTITSPRVELATEDARRYPIRDMRLRVHSDDVYRDTIEIEFDSRHDAEEIQPDAPRDDQVPPVAAARIASRTTVHDLMDAQGRIDHENLRFETDTRLLDVPGALVDRLTTADGRVAAITGETANLVVTGTYPGNLDVQLQGSNLNTTIKANVTGDRVLTLREDIVAHLQVNEDAATQLLGSIQPALGDAIASERPIRLTVKKDDLTLNLREGFDISKVELRGELDIGIIRMDRAGWLRQGITGLVGEAYRSGGVTGMLVGRAVPADEEQVAQTYLATFTPMTFALRDGLLTSSDVWVTSTDMALGFDGRVNLVSGDMEFAMGVLGASLLFDGDAVLQRMIDPENIYDIPVTGTIGGKPDIDYSVMGLYLVGSTLKRQAGVFGGLVDLVGRQVQDGVRRDRNIAWNPPREQLNMVLTNWQVELQRRDEILRERRRAMQEEDEAARRAAEEQARRDAARDQLGPPRDRDRDATPDTRDRGSPGDALRDIFRDLERQRERERDFERRQREQQQSQ